MPVFDEQTTRRQLQIYLNLGMYPIPLWAASKKAIIKGWTNWDLRKHNMNPFINPRVNWGVRGGRLLSSDGFLYFVDLDAKELLGEFFEKHPSLLCAPLVSTNRGWHIWLSWGESVKTRVFQKMEIRGTGAYVVVPPSIHQSGHAYRFVVPLKDIPPLFDPERLSGEPPTPQLIVLNSRGSTDFKDKDISTRSQVPAGVPQGQRHTVLVSFLGALHKSCFTEMEALSKALTWNAKNIPSLPNNEVIATVRDCWARWDRMY